MSGSGPVVVVTGGAGFLGRALVRALTEPRGEPALRPSAVRVLDVRPLPAGLRDERVTAQVGDVRDPAALRSAFAGADLVYHLAAVVDWGHQPAERVRSVNVDGTRQVIAAAQAAHVRALVATSSEDAVYAGAPIRDGDESLPYPARFASLYCETKAAAERLVLAADGVSGNGRGQKSAGPSGGGGGPGGGPPGGGPPASGALRTAVVRPCSVWGEGDPWHVDSLLAMSRRAPLPRIGDGRARFQGVYVGNCAHLLALAGRALLDGRPGVAGEVFYATDYPARNFFDFFEPVLTALGHRMLPWSLALPAPLAYGLGALNEALCRALRPVVALTPRLSRFGVISVCQDHTYRTDKAARRLGYAPPWTEDEAFAATIAWYRARRAAGN